MAWLEETSRFDPDAYTSEVIGLATVLSHHDSGIHSHRKAQLLYTRHGCVRITLANCLCLLPPSRAAWIPPRVTHRVQIRSAVEYRSVYLREDICATLPADVRVIAVSPLLEAVLEAIANSDFEQEWADGRHTHILGLCIDEIRNSKLEPMLLVLPKDRRVARSITKGNRVPPELKVLEREAGATGKTITRIFQKETGMTYHQWRQQWRVMRAIELLATGQSISHVAAELKFSSNSVFIAFFRKMVGSTPGRYLQKAGA